MVSLSIAIVVGMPAFVVVLRKVLVVADRSLRSLVRSFVVGADMLH